MATMNPAAAGGVPYRVPPEPKRLPSAVLAAMMHAGLLFFLWAGVNWQNTEPVSVEAEMWDMTVQSAAAPPEPQPEPVREPEPEPVPRVAPPVEEPVAAKPPDIALERLKEQKLKDKKLAEEKIEKEKELKKEKKLLEELRQKELADKKALEKADKLAKAAKEAAEQKTLQKLRDAEMRRITGAAGTSGTAEKSTAPRSDASYYAAIAAKLKSNVNYAGSTDVPGDPKAEFQIEQLPTGEILSARMTKSSGVPAYDEAAKNAITKSSPLPKKKDGTVERSVPATFRLKENVD